MLLTNELEFRHPILGTVVKAFLIFLNKCSTDCVVSESKCQSMVVLMDLTCTERHSASPVPRIWMNKKLLAKARLITTSGEL